MHTKYEQYIRTTYQKIRNNLINGLRNLNISLPEFEDINRLTFSDLLGTILMDFSSGKQEALSLRCQQETPIINEELELLQIHTTSLRNLISYALTELPSSERPSSELPIFNTGRYKFNTITEFLCHLGEIELFVQAFNTLYPQNYQMMFPDLFPKTFLRIYSNIHHAYEGSLVSESVGLSSSILGRGSNVYIQMAEWMLSQNVNPPQIISLYLESREEKPSDLPRLISSPIKSLNYYKANLWDCANPKDDTEANIHALAEEQYKEFVTKHQGKHLFYEFLYKNLPLEYKPNQYLSPSFYLEIVTRQPIKTAAMALLLIAGLAAFTVGSLSLMGLISGIATKEAAILTTIGAITPLIYKGFFASSPLKDNIQVDNATLNCSP